MSKKKGTFANLVASVHRCFLFVLFFVFLFVVFLSPCCLYVVLPVIALVNNFTISNFVHFLPETSYNTDRVPVQTDRQTDREGGRKTNIFFKDCEERGGGERERERERQRDRETERQRQTDRDRQTDRHISKTLNFIFQGL